MPSNEPDRYIPGLDGLRAVAVVAVIAYHFGFGWASGGFLGVSLFFTLSGFLITRLLLHERERTGTTRIVGFWVRRVRRLAPASLAVLTAVLIVDRLSPDQFRLTRLDGDLRSAVLSVANWRFVITDTDYGDLFAAGPSPVLHFWSLAVEEQFYLIFPLLVAVVARWHRSALPVTLSILIVGSVAAALGSGAELAYYGTHTRAAEILIGAVAACWWTARSGHSTRFGSFVAPIGLAAFVTVTVVVDGIGGWLTNGGLAGLAVVWAALILAVASMGDRGVGRLLSSRPAVAIGRRSYSWYLVHWPVLAMFPVARLGVGTWPARAIQLVAIVVVAEASYQLIERPIRSRRALPGPSTAATAFAVTTAVILGGSLLATQRPANDLAIVPAEPVSFAAEPSPASAPDTRRQPARPDRQWPQIATGPDDEAKEPADPTAQPLDTASTSRSVAPAPVPKLVVAGPLTSLPDRIAAEFEIVDLTTSGCTIVAPTDSCGLDRIDAADPDVVVVGFDESDNQAVIDATTAGGDGLDELQRIYHRLLADLERHVRTDRRIVFTYRSGEVDGRLMRALRQVDLSYAAATIAEASALDDHLMGLDVDTDMLRVMVIGDSTSYGFANAVGSAGRPIDVLWTGRSACPLVDAERILLFNDEIDVTTCPGIDNGWRQQIVEFQPDLVVAVSGLTEQVDHYYNDDTGWVAAGDEAYRLAHDEWIAEMETLLEPHAATLVIASSPPDPEGAEPINPRERIDAWNEQIVGWQSTHDHVELIDFARVLLDAERSAGTNLRPDRIHLSPEGVATVGPPLADALLGIAGRSAGATGR